LLITYGSDITPLGKFIHLELLVLDSNRITDHTKIPRMEKLHTLWVNKNHIANLAIFIDKLVEFAPNLKFLSMLNNDACPNYFNGGTLKQYTDYR
jgi:Leucine-rich repeat (LRR) protein